MLRDSYRTWTFVTIALSEIESRQPQDVLQNLLREIERISDYRPGYLAAYVAKPGMPHLHVVLHIAPGSLAWNALAAWATYQNGRRWLSRVRFEEITSDKGGLSGAIAYFIGPRNLNRHPGRIMRSNDLIEAVTALVASMPVRGRHKPADAPKAPPATSVPPDPIQATPAPSYGLDDIDNPPADSARHPDEDSLSSEEIENSNLTIMMLSPILLRVYDRKVIHLRQSRKEPNVTCQTQDHSRTAARSENHLGVHPKRDSFGRIHRRCIRLEQTDSPRSLRHRAPPRQRFHRSRDPPAAMDRGPRA